MRFLPVFLDLQSGVVLLVGAGELVRAKLRLLASAGANIRWFATDGSHDVAGLNAADAARIERASGDPLAVMTTSVAPFLRAISALSIRSLLRPELLITTATSPGPSIVALITCTWPSLIAAQLTPRRKNLCCASCATMPELPTP